MIEVYNYPKKYLESKQEFLKKISKAVDSYFKKENITIIFVNLKEIQELNLKYREVDAPTDVLSFNYNTEDLLGEVYVSIQYIEAHTTGVDLREEIYRLILHGILHLYGYDHKTEFIDLNQKDIEDMFLIQEKLLKKVLQK